MEMSSNGTFGVWLLYFKVDYESNGLQSKSMSALNIETATFIGLSRANVFCSVVSNIDSRYCFRYCLDLLCGRSSNKLISTT
jgi:hypothetical protein